MGKALHDRQLISGRLAQYLYKQILGWPITFTDLQTLEAEYYKSIIALMEMDDVEYACLDFTVVEEVLGSRKNIELIPGGSEIDVTKQNLVEYLEAMLEYRLVGRVKDQLKELLLGFYDVIPESLLTIFDFQEVSDSYAFLDTISHS